MSKVGYYVPQTLMRHRGIRQRSEATLCAWKRLGIDPVKLCKEPDWDQDLSAVGLLKLHVQSDSAAARTAESLLQSGAIDHIHARLLSPTPGWLKLADRYGISLEIHGRLWRPEHFRDFVGRVAPFGLIGKSLVRKSSAAAFVTHELAEVSSYSDIPRKVVIGNGIELGSPVPAPVNEAPVVGMAIGLDAPWNGLDVMADWARSLDHLDFVVICPAELAEQLETKLDYRSLQFRPTNSHEEYLTELSRLDAALGSLAAERKKAFELAALKVRDYLNLGIPTMLVTPDANLLGVEDGAIQLRSKPVDLAELEQWIRSMVGRRVEESTRQNVSIDMVEKKRLEIFL